jgi:TRIAD3 protein (E3 ubiquitin-protein ligase RNF216)
MEDCRVESCRKCGKEPHIPLRCEEVVQEKRQDEGRLKVEEAISAAKIRACPKCKVSFIKSDGCNKMTCSCGVWVCYICRQIVPKSTGYDHFCQKPHCTHASCKKCQLYSKVEEDDEMAMKEAGVDAAESFREELLKDTENNAEGVDVNIDVSAIMQDPTAASARKKRAVQLPPGMAGMAGMQADIALLLRRQHRQRAQRR